MVTKVSGLPLGASLDDIATRWSCPTRRPLAPKSWSRVNARASRGGSSPAARSIRKEPLGADAQRRVQHELAMLERLRGAKGIAQLADAPPSPGSITLVDVGGASAVELTEAVGRR